MTVVATLLLIASVCMMVGPLFVPYNLKRNIWDQTDRNLRIYVCGMFLFLVACMMGDASSKADRIKLEKVEYNEWVRECRAAKTGCSGWYGQGEK